MMDDKIFGYSFEEIKRAQQGGRLGRLIDTSRPSTDDARHEESDLALLRQYGEDKLRDMGYMGVIDRLERGGHLSSGDHGKRGSIKRNPTTTRNPATQDRIKAMKDRAEDLREFIAKLGKHPNVPTLKKELRLAKRQIAEMESMAKRNPRKITDLNTKRKYFWFKGWVIEDTWSGWLARPSQLAGDRVKNITWRDTGEDKSDTLRKIKQAITDSGIKGTIPKRVVDDWNEEYARRHDKRRSMYYRKNPDSKLPRGAVNSCQRLLSNSASGAIKAHNLCEKVMRKSTDIASFEKALDHALGAKHSLDNAIARMREEIDAL